VRMLAVVKSIRFVGAICQIIMRDDDSFGVKKCQTAKNNGVKDEDSSRQTRRTTY